ncbi:MAG: NERD domain-containing protein [Burkholderiaceae bacterium]|nr:MAG: NERD domain-containing protein [Burkholderiaceae bacterium]
MFKLDNKDVPRLGGYIFNWPALWVTYTALYAVWRLAPAGFDSSLQSHRFGHTPAFRLLRRSFFFALLFLLTISVYTVLTMYVIKPAAAALEVRFGEFALACTLGAVIHFGAFVRIGLHRWKTSPHTVWASALAYGVWLLCLGALLDGLRGLMPFARVEAFALTSAGAMIIWMLLRPVWLMVLESGIYQGIQERRTGELNAAAGALAADKAQGKEGEARVHEALHKALPHSFRDQWSLLPQGGLLPIEGGIPYTDIDHIAVTPQGIIAIETKDWAWDKISPVPGDEAIVERRRSDQVERFKNPYLQAQMKPKHLRNSLGLAPDVPIHFAVVFANHRNHLADGFPPNMLTLRALPAWLSSIARSGAPRIDVVDMAQRLRQRLDYSDQAYEQFRLAIDSGSTYSGMMERECEARSNLGASTPIGKQRHAIGTRPGLVPRFMLYTSFGMLAAAYVLNGTGFVGSGLAQVLKAPTAAAFGAERFIWPNAMPLAIKRRVDRGPGNNRNSTERLFDRHR